MMKKVPLIVILGSTGTGKSKLSIELAKRFNAEIISADSMQVYKGLSIATAKVTREEQSQAPHHLLDVATPNEPFTVTHFRDKALPIIESLLQKSTIPIIVGGTNYYIESILWHVLVSTNANGHKRMEAFSKLKIETREFLTATTNMELYESSILHKYLKEIDPVTAHKLHPNNKRKIMRALEVFQKSGDRLSDIIEEQRNSPGGSNLGGPLRYPHVLIFWLQCQQEILNERLDARVDSMVVDGLLREIREFYNAHVKDRESDYTDGILQTIGFKEFIPYLEKYDESHDAVIDNYAKLSDKTSRQEEPEGLSVLNQCLDELKLVTKRYSKKQIKWIKNRFLGNRDRQVPAVYGLDTSNVSEWQQKVYQLAEQTVMSYLEDLPNDALKPLDPITRLGDGLNEETSHFCDICNRVFIGEFQFQLHMQSNKHKTMKARLNKLKYQKSLPPAETSS